MQGLILYGHQPVKDNLVYNNLSLAFTRSIYKKYTAVLKSGERFDIIAGFMEKFFRFKTRK